MSLLQVKDVTHHYTARKLFKWKAPSKQVLSNVSFSIEEGACLGM
ncbi:nickel import ATP-binding protein NikE, partial [Bacillus paralicheniformis]|nr:nickel import ATP-binding protein NikE [Bacillus paralicheniformis]